MNSLELKKFPALSYTVQEALNTLCTNLAFSGDVKKMIMVTSCYAGEGKSFISMNLMRTLAELGYRVVFVDADLRRSQVKSRFNMRILSGNGSGTSHFLAGMCDVDDVIYETNLPGAYMVPVGREVKNSLSLLNSSKLPVLLDRLASRFDYVIIDAPPVGVIIDAAQIAKQCDGILLTVRYNKVSRRELISAKNQLDSTGTEILGAILNDVAFDTLSSKKYYNKSYYSNYYYNYYSTAGDGTTGSPSLKGSSGSDRPSGSDQRTRHRTPRSKDTNA